MKDKQLRAERSKRYRAFLETHVLKAWFPRCIDREYGGFLTNFDYRWRPRDPQNKLLEFQARQTLLAADLLSVYPKESNLQRAVDTGYAFLRDVMWDAQGGGWFTEVNRAGAPNPRLAKHLHGVAYAIQACASVYVAIHESEALDLALRGFAWMDNLAHDDEYGGYRALEPHKLQGDRDHIDTPIGMKDMNVHSDLLESLTVVYRATEDANVGVRLTELVDLIVRHYADDEMLRFYRHPDWQGAMNYMQYGNALQTASRLLELNGLVGEPRKLESAAVRLINAGLDGWDHQRGGVFYGCTYPPDSDRVQQDSQKQWWVQIEALKAAVLYERLHTDGKIPVTPEDIFDYLERNFIDHTHGGIFERARNGFSLPHRLLRRRRYLESGYKADIWKDGSHEGRAMLAMLNQE